MQKRDRAQPSHGGRALCRRCGRRTSGPVVDECDRAPRRASRVRRVSSGGATWLLHASSGHAGGVAALHHLQQSSSTGGGTAAPVLAAGAIVANRADPSWLSRSAARDSLRACRGRGPPRARTRAEPSPLPPRGGAVCSRNTTTYLTDFASSESRDEFLHLLADADEVIEERERICRGVGRPGRGSPACVVGRARR